MPIPKEIFTIADSFPKTKSEHSWSATKEPSDLGRKGRHLLSNIEGSIRTDSSRNICQIEINQLPTYKNLTHQLFGYTQTDIYDHVVETYQISPEDYYSFKDLLFQKSDNSYLFSHKKDKQQQLIHVITELYITEKEYVEKKQSIKSDSSTPKESAAAITDFCIRNKIPSLPEATEQEMQQLTPYNPANMKEIKE